MLSGYCKYKTDDLHQYCTRKLRLPWGKVFKCSCSCHKAQDEAEREEIRRRKALAAEDELED